MKKEKKICPVCREEIKPPEVYWESVDACSACIRKAIKELYYNPALFQRYSSTKKVENKINN